MRLTIGSAALAIVAMSTAAGGGQVLLQPTPEPRESAADRGWYRLGEPVIVAGELYYPTGPTVFFRGNVMSWTGTYDGVPLYMDATLEPYSLVFVPVGRGLMKPYERRRTAEVAGTTGSRAPSFPVEPAGALAKQESSGMSLPSSEPESRGTSGDFRREEQATVLSPAPVFQYPMATARRPAGNAGVWLEFGGHRWRSAGKAVAFDHDQFTWMGEYRGFPVYRRGRCETAESPGTIYLPSREGLVAPYERVNPGHEK